MAIYDYDPDSGLPRDTPEPASDELVTEQRRIGVAARYAAADAKAAAIDPALQQYQNGYASARQMYGDSYADYLINHDRELASKGRALTPWPRSLQGNDGD